MFHGFLGFLVLWWVYFFLVVLWWLFWWYFFFRTFGFGLEFRVGLWCDFSDLACLIVWCFGFLLNCRWVFCCFCWSSLFGGSSLVFFPRNQSWPFQTASTLQKGLHEPQSKWSTHQINLWHANNQSNKCHMHNKTWRVGRISSTKSFSGRKRAIFFGWTKTQSSSRPLLASSEDVLFRFVWGLRHRQGKKSLAYLTMLQLAITVESQHTLYLNQLI